MLIFQHSGPGRHTRSQLAPDAGEVTDIPERFLRRRAPALPEVSERAGWSDEALICQSGSCEGCGSEVRSWSKRAECPVCGNAVGCT